MLRMNQDLVDKDVDDLQQLLMDHHVDILEEAGEEEEDGDVVEQEALWELKTSPAWEDEEEEEFDLTKERRLSGTDPVSLWGDMLSP